MSTAVRPLRVFQVTNMWPSAERPHWGAFIRSQVESLPAVGIEPAGRYEIEGWKGRLAYIRALRRIPRAVATSGAELVHIHHGLSAIACGALRGLPLVVSFCGSDLLGRPDSTGRTRRRSLVMAAWCRRAARRADAVIVKSAEMARALGPWPDVEIIPNGVDLSLFSPVPKAQARARLGWPAHQPVLLFPANPREPRKNFPCAESAAVLLQRRGLPVRLEWIYARPQTEVALAMNAADVMLNPSYQEGSPNVVKEAMAVGLPVISSDCGDVHELLSGCSPGAVVDRTPEAFAGAIAAVLAAGRRSNGRERVAALDLPLIAGRVRGVYERALARFAARTARVPVAAERRLLEPVSRRRAS